MDQFPTETDSEPSLRGSDLIEDSIDATSIADWVGHEYYALNPDIPLLFRHWSVTQRNLQEAKTGGYYILLAHHS